MKNRILALTLSLALSASLLCPAPALAAKDEQASTVRLTAVEGSVSLVNKNGKSVSVSEDMRLFSGYKLTTGKGEYAYLTLDDKRVAKLDQLSAVEIKKSGEQLELCLSKGDLFFNVDSPLKSSESLNIRTSTMTTGIRGTCGVVRVDSWEQTEIYLFEGEVAVTATNAATGATETKQVAAGQLALSQVNTAGAQASVTIVGIEEKQVPSFATAEVRKDSQLQEKLRQESPLDVDELLDGEEEKRAQEERLLLEQESLQPPAVPAAKPKPFVPGGEESSSGGGSSSDGGSTPAPAPSPSDSPTPTPGPSADPVSVDLGDYFTGGSTTPPDFAALFGAADGDEIILVDSLAGSREAPALSLEVPGGKRLSLNCDVSAGQITVADGAALTVSAGKTLTLLGSGALSGSGALEVEGTLDNRGTLRYDTAPSGSGTVHNSAGTLTPGDGGYCVLDSNLDVAKLNGALAMGVAGSALGGLAAGGSYTVLVGAGVTDAAGLTLPAAALTLDCGGSTVDATGEIVVPGGGTLSLQNGGFTAAAAARAAMETLLRVRTGGRLILESTGRCMVPGAMSGCSAVVLEDTAQLINSAGGTLQGEVVHCLDYDSDGYNTPAPYTAAVAGAFSGADRVLLRTTSGQTVQVDSLTIPAGKTLDSAAVVLSVNGTLTNNGTFRFGEGAPGSFTCAGGGSFQPAGGHGLLRVTDGADTQARIAAPADALADSALAGRQATFYMPREASLAGVQLAACTWSLDFGGEVLPAGGVWSVSAQCQLTLSNGGLEYTDFGGQTALVKIALGGRLTLGTGGVLRAPAVDGKYVVYDESGTFTASGGVSGNVFSQAVLDYNSFSDEAAFNAALGAALDAAQTAGETVRVTNTGSSLARVRDAADAAAALTVPAGKTLQLGCEVAGSINNAGTLVLYESAIDGSIVNTGTLELYGFAMAPGGTLNNMGIIENRGTGVLELAVSAADPTAPPDSMRYAGNVEEMAFDAQSAHGSGTQYTVYLPMNDATAPSGIRVNDGVHVILCGLAENYTVESLSVNDTGRLTLQCSLTGTTQMEISASGTLAVEAGSTLSNTGTLTNNGTVDNRGSIVNTGTVINNGTVVNTDGATVTKGTWSGNEPQG